MTARAWAVALCCVAWQALAATPQLDISDGQLGLPGSRVPSNLLINLSLTFADAQAAYRGSYERKVAYAGYFNARLCYTYPMKSGPARVAEPEPDPRRAFFSVHKAADALHECGADSFSGNFLNWASASRLDLLRYALTGGDRVIDEPGLTVLQRAWLPDGSAHPDFYASEAYFPRKRIAAGSAGSAPDKVTPFSAGVLYIVSCRNRILFSNSAKGGRCDEARFGPSGERSESDKYFGEFNARVSVCGADDAASRPDLCRKYADGFKPEGSVQAYAANMRIGLMSYLTQHGAGDPNLYGGVLRAPLKFVGASKFDAPDFAASANGQGEWDGASGVLAGNPERAASAASGAINYINQLGRTPAARPGWYKASDPGAELFYESLRYLQNREAGAGPGAPADDAGFPVWRTRSDPVTAACQRNVVATIGHASFVEDRYLPGNTRTDHKDGARAADAFAPGAAFDIMLAARRVGEMEADPAGKYLNRAPRPDLLGIERIDDGPSGAGSLYLAGAAFWAHTNAIRPDKPVRVDHYSLELGAPAKARSSALYLAAKYGGFDDRNGDANPFITTGDVANDSEWRGGDAMPRHFFAASDPHDIISASRSLFANALAGSALLPGRTAAAGRHDGANFLIRSDYEQADWSGTLQRFALTLGADGSARAGTAPVWDAAAILNGDAGRKPALAPRPGPAARKIHTLVRQPDKSGATVEFRWDKLAPEQRAYLDLSPSDVWADGLGQARVDFLRGERSREIGQREGVFRRRSGVLGDAIHSTPLVVGAPSASVQGPGYSAFHARYKERRGAVYVGANDGMLHAFDAANGSELFAYVPNALVPALNLLTSPAYRHRAYVDGSPAAAEAVLNGAWRTVLVSGMGMGARGVFALDVSDPAAFGSGMGALWEFTDKDDPAMGHVSAAPRIVRLKTGVAEGVSAYRYFAIVASGVGNYARDGKDDDGAGALFLLALDKPAAAAWRVGVNYHRFTTPISDSTQANALAQPALALGPDATLRFAYAGDLQGNLWRFDFSGTAPWPDAAGPGKEMQPLFVARDAAGRRQPITQTPTVVFAPGGGYLVLFGTGKFMEEADLLPASFASQSFYAIHDTTIRRAVRARSELVERTLWGSTSYAIRGADFEPGLAARGWYFDFPHATEDGERVVGAAVAASGALILNSLVPGRDACAAPASRTYVLDTVSGFAFDQEGMAASGAATGRLTHGAAGAPPLLIETSTSVGQRSATGRAAAIRSFAMLDVDAASVAAANTPIKIALPAKRFSWREVANWQELHDAAGRK